jgi:hypothetical protein
MATLGVLRILVVLLLGFGTVTLSTQPVRAASAPASQEVQHEVLPGDCLHLIAGYYYGDARLWGRIWKANKESVRNPDVLALGTVLVVPDATVPDQPYPDFAARTHGCGPARAARAAAARVKGQPKAAPSAPTTP